ncbi:major facilitator superfamily domain-containing protein [Tricladium varicosporioides]|nr:major facilitator superfamily domain-containing protein [Hymenoscyphus varicosporioides]
MDPILPEDDTEKEAASSEEVVGELQQAPTSIIPDGGLTAWLQVLGAHLIFFNSWGIVNTFGVYQAYYKNDLLKHRSSSDISWIGTFQGFILVIFGIFSGPVFDQGHFRFLLFTGTFFVVFGLMMTSLATEYWQLLLTQGICVGMGGGFIFLPSAAIVATYFDKKRALAMGVTAAGGSVGSVIYPIVFRKLQPRIGFPWATRVIGFLSLGTLAISILTMKTRLPPTKQARRPWDPAALRSVTFVLFSIGLFLTFIGLYIPFFYIVLYAQRKLHIGGDLPSYLLTIVNASSVVGRIASGALADKFGSLEILTVCTLTSAIMIYSWMAAHNLAGIIIFALIFGCLSGAVVSLPTTVVANLVPELRLVGTWMGMCFLMGGLGLLIGNPIAGTLIKVGEANFFGGIIFSATTVMASSVVLVCVGLLRPGPFIWKGRGSNTG